METQSEVGYHKNRQDSHSATKKADEQSINQRTNKFSKRSEVMNANKLFLSGLMAILSIILMVSLVGAQTFKNGGTLINAANKLLTAANFQNYKAGLGTVHNAGTLNVSGTFTNGDGSLNSVFSNYYGATGGTAYIGTLVQNTGASGAVNNDSGATPVLGWIKLTGATPLTLTTTGFASTKGRVEFGGATTQTIPAPVGGYGVLITSGTGAKSLGAATTINDSGRIAGAALKVNGYTLAVTGSGITVVTAGTDTVDASTASSIVQYNGTGNQNVAPGSYNALVLANGVSQTKKTVPGNLHLLTSLSIGATDSLDVSGGSQLNIGSSVTTFTNDGTVAASGDVIFNATVTNAGGFTYYATSTTQNIGASQYTNLTLQGGGAKVFANAAYTVSGNYTVAGGTGTRTYTVGNSIEFNGSTDQSVAGELYYKLIIGNTGAVATLAANTQATNTSNNDALWVKSGAVLVIPSGITMQTNTGDLSNDGTITNNGTILVQ